MAITNKLEAMDSLNEVGDTLNMLLYVAEQMPCRGTTAEACFVRDVARLLNQRAHQVWEIRDYLEAKK